MKKFKFIVTLMLIFVTSAAYAQFSNTASIKSKSNGGGDYNKVSFRIQAGMNISSLTVFDELLEDMATEDAELKSKVGFNLGFRVDKQFNRYFAFQTGLDYTLKGVRTYYEDEEEESSSYGSYSAYEEGKTNLSLHYIQLPILVGARYDFNGKVPVQLQFNTGPYFAVAVAGKQKETYEGEYESYYYGDRERETWDKEYKRNAFGDYKDNKDAKDYEDTVLGLKRFDIGWRFDLGVDINKFYLGVAYDLGFFDVQGDDLKKDLKDAYGKNKYEALKTGNFSINIGCRF